MTQADKDLKRGIFWIGSSTLLTRLIEAAAVVFVLSKLSTRDLGLASLVWGMGVALEAFNGLGVGAALVQSKDLADEETHSLFWFSGGVGVASAAVTLALAPVLSWFYGEPALLPMIAASGVKFILVGFALVPQQLLVRSLQFRETGAVNTASSFLESVTKIILALAGAGAWALVGANILRGAYVLIASFSFCPYRPKYIYEWPKVKRFVSFGMRVSAATITYQVYRNADYFLVGKVLGAQALGVYRAAFEIAMTPQEVIQQVVNRVAFPIYSKLADDIPALKDAFLATARRLILLATPVVLVTQFGVDDLIFIMKKPEWLPAIPMVRILAWGGLIRGLVAAFPRLFHAKGKPEYAILEAVMSGVTLVLSFAVGLALFAKTMGASAVAWGWILSYPPVMAMLLYLAHKLIGLRLREYIPAVGIAVFAMAVAGAVMGAVDALLPSPSLATFAALVVVGVLVQLGFGRFATKPSAKTAAAAAPEPRPPNHP